jgi:hypothetical protein
MGKAPNLDDYVDVPARIQDFRKAYPEGTLQAECQFSQVADAWWVVVKAYAYRNQEDKRPGTGLAWELVPGKTPYTKDSELQNAETSAWGRAIIAVGASDAKKIASREEVRNRQDVPPPDNEEGRAALRELCSSRGLPPEAVSAVFRQRFNVPAAYGANEDLHAFVAGVRDGLIQINIDDQPAG